MTNLAILSLLCLALAGTSDSFAAPAQSSRPNVLFIAVDDLRPQLGCYGDPLALTSSIDSLAKEGMVFTHAYCQQAVCSPSRSSLLTGCRPDTTKVWDLKTHFRRALPQAVTLPQYFKQNGYDCRSLSKIYHHGFEDPLSWSAPAWFPKDIIGRSNPAAASRPKAKADTTSRTRSKAAAAPSDEIDTATGMVLKQNAPHPLPQKGASWEACEVADNALPDGETADKAIETLREIKDKPFFLAVGFLRPHLPFIAPRKYYDLYPPEKIKLPDNCFAPKDVPKVALHNFEELRSYTDIPDVGPIDDQKARELIRGYYAATSYMDAQLGRVLDELKRLGLADNTIVVLWGDHGWQLGEHGLWCKHTNFEVATRAPLVVRVPGKMSAGGKCERLVEFVDLYPTLGELCGLEPPQKVEGTSFAPLLTDPARPWKKAAFSQYPRPGKVMGYSMRTERYRYTEWLRGQEQTLVGCELYDHEKDPGENENLALRAENAELTPTLSRMLHEGWKSALPPGRSTSQAKDPDHE